MNDTYTGGSNSILTHVGRRKSKYFSVTKWSHKRDDSNSEPRVSFILFFVDRDGKSPRERDRKIKETGRRKERERAKKAGKQSANSELFRSSSRYIILLMVLIYHQHIVSFITKKNIICWRCVFTCAHSVYEWVSVISKLLHLVMFFFVLMAHQPLWIISCQSHLSRRTVVVLLNPILFRWGGVFIRFPRLLVQKWMQ